MFLSLLWCVSLLLLFRLVRPSLLTSFHFFLHFPRPRRLHDQMRRQLRIVRLHERCPPFCLLHRLDNGLLGSSDLVLGRHSSQRLDVARMYSGWSSEGSHWKLNRSWKLSNRRKLSGGLQRTGIRPRESAVRLRLSMLHGRTEDDTYQ
jgi:hypothetical protein